MTALVVVETFVVALLVLLVAGLLRSHAEILRRLHDLSGAGPAATVEGTEGPPAPERTRGARATDIVGTTLDGDPVKVAVTDVGRDTLLAFLSSGCLTCRHFWESLAPERRGDLPGDARVVVVTKDPSLESPARLRQLASPGLAVTLSSAAWDAYGVPVSPYFVHVDGATGQIDGEGAAERWDQIVSLLRDAWEDRQAVARRSNKAPGAALRADLELRAARVGREHPSLYLPNDPTRVEGPP